MSNSAFIRITYALNCENRENEKYLFTFDAFIFFYKNSFYGTVANYLIYFINKQKIYVNG